MRYVFQETKYVDGKTSSFSEVKKIFSVYSISLKMTRNKYKYTLYEFSFK